MQVTLGKPIGNGFPMGAVVMSPALAHGFDNGMQYFATCGGCTASGAAGVFR
jgi:ethanolamine-phosphate phospho-lyase